MEPLSPVPEDAVLPDPMSPPPTLELADAAAMRAAEGNRRTWGSQPPDHEPGRAEADGRQPLAQTAAGLDSGVHVGAKQVEERGRAEGERRRRALCRARVEQLGLEDHGRARPLQGHVGDGGRHAQKPEEGHDEVDDEAGGANPDHQRARLRTVRGRRGTPKQAETGLATPAGWALRRPRMREGMALL